MYFGDINPLHKTSVEKIYLYKNPNHIDTGM